MSSDHLVYLGIGSNIHPKQNIENAIVLLMQSVDVRDISSVWETPPVGSAGAPRFLNAVILIRTPLNPHKLKEGVLRWIEERLGRQRTSNKNAPREIDIDILIFDDQVIDAEIWHQAHWAVPLAELKPNLTDPQTGENLETVAKRLSSQTIIRNRKDIYLKHLLTNTN